MATTCSALFACSRKWTWTQGHLVGPVYFDLFGEWVVGWPLPFTLPLAVVVFVLVIATVVVLARRGVLKRWQWLAATALWVVAFSAAMAAVLGVHWALDLGGALKEPWVEAPWLYGVGFAGAALVAVVFVGYCARRLGAWAIWSGVWTAWAILGLVLAIRLPTGSYLVLAPALVASGVGFCFALFARRKAWTVSVATIVAIGAAACLWFPAEFLLYDLIGFGISYRHAGTMAMFATALLPLGALGWPPQ